MEDLEKRIETDTSEKWAAEGDDNATTEKIVIGKYKSAVTLFINLYILSDKVLDPITANSVIDKLITFTSKARYRLNPTLVAHIYASTTESNPLRMLARDLYVHDTDRSWPLNQAQEHWAGFPLDFMRDLLVEIARCQVAHPEMKI
jgi:hypothetical protein